MAQIQPGDWVIYRKTKFSPQPGPRAFNIAPSPGGEEYSYQVDKYWVVVSVNGGTLVLSTRTGKRHEVSSRDPLLRRANFWERLWLRSRFPEPTAKS